jgi:regulator of sigma E protease
MTVLIFLIVISILIIVHEFGHFIIAKSLGIRIEKFVLGFGPEILRLKRKYTEYAISLIPFGGYVKLSGDTWEECKGKKYEYLSRPVGQRARIVVFGPILNYVLAFFCFCLVFLIGFPSLTSEVGELIDNYPAQESGLLPGDKIISVDGKDVRYWEELQQIIFNKKEGMLKITAIREDKKIEFDILPKREKIKNIFGQEETVSLIGIKPAEKFVQLKYPLLGAIIQGSKRLIFMTGLTYKALYMILTGGISLRDSVTGPLGIFFITEKAFEQGFVYLIHLIAILSMSLAIFNLVPLPILDGGHLIMLVLEKLRGRPLSRNIDEWINRIGLGFLIFLALFIFYSDLVRYGVLEKIIGWVK